MTTPICSYEPKGYITMSLRDDLDRAYKTATALAQTPEERESLRAVFRKLFVAAKRKKTHDVKLPVPDPLGILSDISKHGPIQLYDPLRERESKPEPKPAGAKLCDQLDDDEMLDFARTVCEDDTAENCIKEVYEFAVRRKDGDIGDKAFNKAVTRTLKHHGTVPKGDYAIMLKMRSPCMVDEILKICNYDPECLDRYQKLAEALDDPFAFRRELEKLQGVIPGPKQ